MKVYTGIQMADEDADPSKDMTKIKTLTEANLADLRWLVSWVTPRGTGKTFRSLFQSGLRIWKHDPNGSPALVDLTVAGDLTDGRIYFPKNNGANVEEILDYIKVIDIGSSIGVDFGAGQSYLYGKVAATDTVVWVGHGTNANGMAGAILLHNISGAFYAIVIKDYVNTDVIQLADLPTGNTLQRCSIFGMDIFGTFQIGFYSDNNIVNGSNEYYLANIINGTLDALEKYSYGANGMAAIYGLDYVDYVNNELYFYDASEDRRTKIKDMEFSIDGIACNYNCTKVMISTVDKKSYWMSVDDDILYEIPWAGKITPSYKFTYVM